MRILGIETSCDETAAAIVRDGEWIESDIVWSQEALHRTFSGVVPEIACRAHTENILRVIDLALTDARLDLSSIDGVAVTTAPGLIGALLVGLSAAKAIAWAADKMLIPVNHLQAHIYAGRLACRDLPYPHVGLVVSGGHTAIYHVFTPTHMELLGSTTDDAAGEAFDKVASVLGLGYPGGPAINRAAQQGDPHAIEFPRAWLDPESLNFSFSGLKTAVLYHCVGKNRKRSSAPLNLNERQVADIAASFQEAVVDVLVAKTMAAAERTRAGCVVIAGGVACNSRLRQRMAEACGEKGLRLVAPPPRLCTDNAATVAGLAFHLWCEGKTGNLFVDACATPVRARY